MIWYKISDEQYIAKDLYKIIEHYSGKFNDCQILAYVPTKSDAQRIVKAMEILTTGRAFSYELVRNYTKEQIPFNRNDMSEEDIHKEMTEGWELLKTTFLPLYKK